MNLFFSVKCVAIFCSIVLSIASYKLIERPFRNKNHLSSRTFILVLLSVVFLLGGFLGNIVYRDGYPGRLPAVFGQLNLMTTPWNYLRKDGLICFNRTEKFCSFPHASSSLNGSSTTSVYSVGDSIFSSLSPELSGVVTKKFTYTEMNLAGCPFVLNVDLFQKSGIKDRNCHHKFQNKRYYTIEGNPSIIIVGGQFQLYTTGFFNSLKPWGEFNSVRSLSFEEEFRLTIGKLEEIGHQVVLVYPIPEFISSAPEYINGQRTRQNFKDVAENFTSLSQGYEKFLERARPTFRLFDSINSDNIHRVYPHTIFCDTFASSECVANTSKDIFYADRYHPSATGSKMIVELIMEQIEKAEATIRNN